MWGSIAKQQLYSFKVQVIKTIIGTNPSIGKRLYKHHGALQNTKIPLLVKTEKPERVSVWEPVRVWKTLGEP